MIAFRNLLIISVIFSLSIFSVDAQDIDKIIEKHIKAHGGTEAWSEVKSLKITGTYTAYSVASDYKAFKTSDGKYWGSFGMGQHPVTEAINSKTAWTLDPWSEIPLPRQVNSAEENVIIQKSEMCTPLMNYKEKGHKVELVGEENIEGINTLKIKLTRENGLEEFWYLDAKTYLEFKLESRWQDFGYPSMQETYFDDFRKVGKITLPFFVERSFSIRNRMLEIDNIEINPEFDKTIFTKPLSKEMQKLESMEGEWNVVVNALTRRGWMQADSTESLIKFHPNNNLLKGKITSENYFKIDRKYNWTYNYESEKYRMSLYSGLTGNLYVFEGNFKNDTLKLDNSGVHFDGISEDKKSFHQYIITDLKKDSFSVHIASSRDKGKTWRVREKLAFTRKE